MNNVNNDMSIRQNDINFPYPNSNIIDVLSPTQIILRLQAILQIQLSRHFNSGDFLTDTIVQLIIITMITYSFTKIPTLLRFFKNIIKNTFLNTFYLFYNLIKLIFCIKKTNKTNNTDDLLWEQKIYINSNDNWVSYKYSNDVKFENIILQNNLKENIIKDIDAFLSSESFYRERNMNYSRDYVFYGDKGTGKKLLIKALSLKYNRNINYLTLDSEITSNDLFLLINSINFKDTFIVVESHDNIQVNINKLFNILNSMMTYDNRILFLLINNRELPFSLRFDNFIQFEFDLCSSTQFEQLFTMFYKQTIPTDHLHLINLLNIVDYSPEYIISIFKKFINNPLDAINHINIRIINYNTDTNTYTTTKTDTTTDSETDSIIFSTTDSDLTNESITETKTTLTTKNFSDVTSLLSTISSITSSSLSYSINSVKSINSDDTETSFTINSSDSSDSSIIIDEIINKIYKEEIVEEEVVKEEIVKEEIVKEVKEEVLKEEVKEEVLKEEVKEEVLKEEVKEEVLKEEVLKEVVEEIKNISSTLKNKRGRGRGRILRTINKNPILDDKDEVNNKKEQLKPRGIRSRGRGKPIYEII